MQRWRAATFRMWLGLKKGVLLCKLSCNEAHWIFNRHYRLRAQKQQNSQVALSVGFSCTLFYCPKCQRFANCLGQVSHNAVNTSHFVEITVVAIPRINLKAVSLYRMLLPKAFVHIAVCCWKDLPGNLKFYTKLFRIYRLPAAFATPKKLYIFEATGWRVMVRLCAKRFFQATLIFLLHAWLSFCLKYSLYLWLE